MAFVLQDINSVTQSNAGAIVVTAGQYWKLTSVSWNVTTSAVVGNRFFFLDLTDENPLPFKQLVWSSVPASKVVRMETVGGTPSDLTLAGGGGYPDLHKEAQFQPIMLPPLSSIWPQCQNPQAGDATNWFSYIYEIWSFTVDVPVPTLIVNQIPTPMKSPFT